MKKIQVNTRLYEADVDKLKSRARALDVPWQAYLRAFLHRALASGKKGKMA
jgi:predicted DNA binding CopG/RHH family protein